MVSSFFTSPSFPSLTLISSNFNSSPQTTSTCPPTTKMAVATAATAARESSSLEPRLGMFFVILFLYPTYFLSRSCHVITCPPPLLPPPLITMTRGSKCVVSRAPWFFHVSTLTPTSTRQHVIAIIGNNVRRVRPLGS